MPRSLLLAVAVAVVVIGAERRQGLGHCSGKKWRRLFILRRRCDAAAGACAGRGWRGASYSGHLVLSGNWHKSGSGGRRALRWCES